LLTTANTADCNWAEVQGEEESSRADPMLRSSTALKLGWGVQRAERLKFAERNTQHRAVTATGLGCREEKSHQGTNQTKQNRDKHD
jgi:hypothetical protein